MLTSMGTDRGRPVRKGVWLWLIIGGILILIPGAVVLYLYRIWESPWGKPDLGWGLLYAVVLGPPAILVVVGVVAIVLGASRYRAARS